MTAAELRPFSFFKDDKGDIYLKGGEHKLGGFDVSKVMDTKSKDYGRMTAFIDLRDTVRELLKVQADDKPENEIQAVQQKLSKQYDDFYKLCVFLLLPVQNCSCCNQANRTQSLKLPSV